MEQSYVPVARWGRDHWRCLAYVEAIMVEMAGFQVGADPRMTANRRHYRVMAEQCPRPKPPGSSGDGDAPGVRHHPGGRHPAGPAA